MKGDWLGYDEMLEEPEYFHLKKGQETKFSEAWALFEIDMKKDTATEKDATESTEAAARQQVTAQDPQAEAGTKPEEEGGTGPPNRPKAKPKKRTAGSPPAEPKPKVAKSDMQTLKTTANKLKVFYHSVVGAAESVTVQIKAGEDFWSWATGDENVGRLEKLTSDLKGRISPMGHKILSTDIGKLKTELGADTTVVELRSFNTLEPHIEAVSAHLEALVEMHEVKKKRAREQKHKHNLQ